MVLPLCTAISAASSTTLKHHDSPDVRVLISLYGNEVSWGIIVGQMNKEIDLVVTNKVLDSYQYLGNT
jgi:hypothetical protein